jgi:hypothetical protein
MAGAAIVAAVAAAPASRRRRVDEKRVSVTNSSLDFDEMVEHGPAK